MGNNELDCLNEWGGKMLGNRTLFSLYGWTWREHPECLWHLHVHEPGLVLSLFLLQTICFTGSSVRYPGLHLGSFQAPHLWGTLVISLVVFAGHTNIFYTESVLNCAGDNTVSKGWSLLHQEVWSPKMSLTVLKLKWYFDWKCTNRQAQKVLETEI